MRKPECHRHQGTLSKAWEVSGTRGNTRSTGKSYQKKKNWENSKVGIEISKYSPLRAENMTFNEQWVYWKTKTHYFCRKSRHFKDSKQSWYELNSLPKVMGNALKCTSKANNCFEPTLSQHPDKIGNWEVNGFDVKFRWSPTRIVQYLKSLLLLSRPTGEWQLKFATKDLNPVLISFRSNVR